jgi:outer membrane protein assembly factor BamA
MLRRIAILLLLVAHVATAVAQNDSILVAGKDTVAYRYTPINIAVPQQRETGWQRFVKYMAESTVDRSFERKVDMTIIPTIYYAPSTSVGIAVVAAGLYRLDKQNRTISPSDFSVYATASLTGYYNIGIRGNNIFRNDDRRLIYNAEFSSQPSSFWGIGYDAAMLNPSLNYLASCCKVDVRFLQRIDKRLFVGLGADYGYHFGRYGGKRYASYDSFTALLDGQRTEYNATGLSLYVELDTRNSINNPERGVYASVQAKIRPRGLNSVGRTLWSGYFTLDYYQRLWRGAVLAFDLRGELNSEGTPWIYNATIGGSRAMRGYYVGRFNDLCAVTLQAELRQHIYRGFGVVAWGGAGNVFYNFAQFEWNQTLPTYGAGLRYRLKQGVTVRFDYGFGCRDARGKLLHGAIFSLNEAF